MKGNTELSNMSKTKNWRFTEFCTTKSLNWAEGKDHLVYAICQLEKCPKTGKLHYQGYLQLDTKKPLTYMKRHFSNTANWGSINGTPEDNITYCSKSESKIAGPWIIGEEKNLTHQGERTDIKDMIEMKISGANYTKMVLEHGANYIRMYKSINHVANMIRSENSDQSEKKNIEVIYLWGPTRSGKSTYARTIDNKAYIKSPDNKWWDYYSDHETVIFEDCGAIDNSKEVNVKMWLRWLDHYKLNGDVKGDFVELKYTKAIITSNIPPKCMCSDLAFLARITICYKFENDHTYKIYDKYEKPPLLAPLATTLTENLKGKP